MMLAERLARLFRYPAVTLDGNIEYLPLSFPASAPLKPTPPKASLALRLLHFAGQPGDVLGLETPGGPQQRRQLDRSALDDVGEVRRHPARSGQQFVGVAMDNLVDRPYVSLDRRRELAPLDLRQVG